MKHSFRGLLAQRATGFVLSASVLALASVAQAQVTPQKADRFVDSIGINTHFNYYTLNSTLQSKLQALGVRYIRDNANSDGIAAAQTLGPLGIKTNFICGRKDASGKLKPTQADVDAELDSLEPIAAHIVSLEGPNEYDLQHPGGDTNWPSTLVDYQKLLYTSAKAANHAPLNSKTVIAPSITSSDEDSAYLVNQAAGGSGPRDNSNLGALAPWMDNSCVHLYQSWRNPGTGGWGALGPRGTGTGAYGSIDYSLNNVGQVIGGSKPIQSTECGYNTGQPSDNRNVPEDVEAKYLPRMFAEFFRKGIVRSYKYEFRDVGSTSSGEFGFGIVKNDAAATEKQAYAALKNLIAGMSDPAPSAPFTPQPLSYTLSGTASGLRQMLFQKSNGAYFLLVWRESAAYNGDTNSYNTALAPATLTLSFPSSISGVATNVPRTSATFSSQTITNNSVALSVADDLIIVRLTPNKYEAEGLDVVAQSSGDSVTTASDASASADALLFLNANASGDFVTLQVPNVAAGTYAVSVGVKKNPNRGKFQLAIAPSLGGSYTNWGSEQDLYNSAASYNELPIGNVTFGTSSDKFFRFTVTGKNGSSSGFSLGFDYIKLVRQ